MAMEMVLDLVAGMSGRSNQVSSIVVKGRLVVRESSGATTRAG
jgi:hypothetical protein